MHVEIISFIYLFLFIYLFIYYLFYLLYAVKIDIYQEKSDIPT